jgi:predicted nucleotidyltransferase
LKPTKENILSVITRELERRGEIVFAYIFGSFVEREVFRDVDVAVYVQENGTAVGDDLSCTMGLWSRYFDIQVKRRAYLKVVAEGTGAP